jgi:hypothetical protein
MRLGNRAFDFIISREHVSAILAGKIQIMIRKLAWVCVLGVIP